MFAKYRDASVKKTGELEKEKIEIQDSFQDKNAEIEYVVRINKLVVYVWERNSWGQGVC